jgi:hypothetical protein
MPNTPKDSAYLSRDFDVHARDAQNQFEESGYDFSLLDTNDENSLVSIINSNILRELILAMPKEYLLEHEKDLAKAAKVDHTDACLRMNFWNEFFEARRKNRHMKIARIYSGICGHDYFIARLERHPKILAWVLHPPMDYIANMRAMLAKGLERMEEILGLNFYDKVPQFDSKGKPKFDQSGKQVVKKQVNAKVLSEIRQTTQWLHEVVKGSVVQRVAIQQQSTNLNLNAPQPNSLYSMEELTKMESQLSRVENTLTIEGEVDKPAEEGSDTSAGQSPQTDN